MSTILDTIAARRLVRTAEKRKAVPLEKLQEQVSRMQDVSRPGFRKAIENNPCGFICEVKKASPSRGIIAEAFDPVSIAHAYADAGACAISCLCEPDWFSGSDTDLHNVSAAVDLPVLKKDFIVDPYMIYEARKDGASAILLIAALLDDATLQSFIDLAHSLQLGVLLEVHDVQEAARAIQTKADVIGINNRDLKTFTTDLHTFEKLRPLIPDSFCCICESGIHTPADMQRIANAGADGVLIGEACMEASDKSAFLQTLQSGLQSMPAREL